MNRKSLFFTIFFFGICAAGIAFLAFQPEKERETQEQRRTRVIIPHETNNPVTDSAEAERMAYEDSINIKVPLNEGEIIIAVLNYDFNGDAMEEQVVAYRSLIESESPIYIAYTGYDEQTQVYRRFWKSSAAAIRPGTVSLYAQDLIGDRNVCILLSGMNSQGEQTLTVFRKKLPAEPDSQPFAKIADLRIDGSITIQETERSQAYQQGIANGQPFTIAAYGHDSGSTNIMDQAEMLYAFNPARGVYEQSKITRIPGSQIEQRRLRELLSGKPGVFEEFINDLWYYVSPQGTLDKSQYIYFDPANKEIIFFGDETQQVFIWQQSTPTRYGLYISSQNISVTTLRRFLTIELASLDSIRIRVSEDVRLRIGINAIWDGSYRRAAAVPKKVADAEQAIKPSIEAVYDSAMGRLRFLKNGVYELSSGGQIKKGRYVFFQANGRNLLELRSDSIPRETETTAGSGASRQIYLVETAVSAGTGGSNLRENLSLSRVRLGAMGIQDLHEGQIILTAKDNGQ